MEEIKMGIPEESINGIFAQLALAVNDKPEIFGDKLEATKIALHDWETELNRDNSKEIDEVEQRLRNLHKILETHNL